MKFDREWLIEDLDDQKSLVREKIIEVTRWSILEERIFKFEGSLYITSYSYGATEMQDESPYDYHDPQIECPEVKEYEFYNKELDETITEYREV